MLDEKEESFLAKRSPKVVRMLKKFRMQNDIIAFSCLKITIGCTRIGQGN
jgi:hypothetical protein